MPVNVLTWLHDYSKENSAKVTKFKNMRLSVHLFTFDKLVLKFIMLSGEQFNLKCSLVFTLPFTLKAKHHKKGEQVNTW